MIVVYAHEPMPAEVTSSIFLAGPTPRSPDISSWRPEAIRVLQDIGYSGTVFVPESRDGQYSEEYDDQVGWEETAMHRADVILFWVPRDLQSMPAFTTNVEFSRWEDSGKVVYGRPENAPKTRYLDSYACKYGFNPRNSLKDTCLEAVTRIEFWSGFHPTHRMHEECNVPLNVWVTPHFQSWYRNLKAAGNRLQEFRTLMVYPQTANTEVFCWVGKVSVWISAEQRLKSNEFVVARPDIFCVALMSGEEIVLVREFRAPVSNPCGYVFELPGGSSKPGQSALKAAREELREETGIDIPEHRFEHIDSRQVAATILSHQAHLYKVVLSDGEAEHVHQLRQDGVSLGAEEDSEKTWPEVHYLPTIFKSPVDWTMLGMIFQSKEK